MARGLVLFGPASDGNPAHNAGQHILSMCDIVFQIGEVLQVRVTEIFRWRFPGDYRSETEGDVAE